jgi:hypothetical protein
MGTNNGVVLARNFRFLLVGVRPFGVKGRSEGQWRWERSRGAGEWGISPLRASMEPGVVMLLGEGRAWKGPRLQRLGTLPRT